MCIIFNQYFSVFHYFVYNKCKYYVCGKIMFETKVKRLHKIRVEKIPLFHLKKCAVNYF